MKSAVLMSLAAAAVLGGTATPLVAAFENRVERFDGTTKDTQTWQEYSTAVNKFTQNDALSFAGAVADAGADYTAHAIPIRVGGFVQADVTVTAQSSVVFRSTFAYLGLTTNSRGTEASSVVDSRFACLEVWFKNDPYFYAFEATNGVGGGSGINDLRPQFGTTYQLRLDRPDAQSIRYSVSDRNGVLMGSSQRTLANLPPALFVTLGASAVDATFDNVVIPEPATAGLLAVASVGLLGRRRARRTKAC